MTDVDKKIEQIEAFRNELDKSMEYCDGHDYERCKLIPCRTCIIDHIIDILKEV